MKYRKEYLSSFFFFTNSAPTRSALLRTNLEVVGSAYLTLSSELDLDTLADVEAAAAISNMGVTVRSAACHTGSTGSPSSKSSRRRSEAAVVTWLLAAAEAEAVSPAGAELALGAMKADSPPLLITSSAYRRETFFRNRQQ